MIIAIPVNENSEETMTVCTSFGRTPYFLFLNTETKERDWIDNRAAASQGGAGIKAAQVIVDHHADVLLTPRCGENAAAVIKAAGIKMYRTIYGSVSENVKVFYEGKLVLLTEVHAGFHHHGGR